jgi:hypothetical protein
MVSVDPVNDFICRWFPSSRLGTQSGSSRFAFPLFPHAAQFFTLLLLVLGLAAMFYAGWIALAQEDLKRLAAYSSTQPSTFDEIGQLSGSIWFQYPLSSRILLHDAQIGKSPPQHLHLV